MEKCIYLGNLDAKRDWGHARDFVEAQWRILQQDKPEDYVIATGKQASIRQFIELTAAELGWNRNLKKPSIIWEGRGLEEVGIRSDTRDIVIRVDKRYFRPNEVDSLLGNPLKAKQKLGWEATTSLEELVKEMVFYDKEKADKEFLLKEKGFNIPVPFENPPNNF